MHSRWIRSSLVDTGGSCERIDVLFWCQEDRGRVVRSLLLAKDEIVH
jgi:hypothetical protein